MLWQQIGNRKSASQNNICNRNKITTKKDIKLKQIYLRTSLGLPSGNNRNQKSPLLPCGEAGLFYHIVGLGFGAMRNIGGGFAARPIEGVEPLVPSHPLPPTFHFAENCHQKGATHEPYQTKSRSCCSGAPCARDGVFLGGQIFLAEREYQFPAPGAPFFSHDHRSGSSARRILQRPFLPSLSEAHE